MATGYVPVSEKDEVQLNTIHRSWWVFRGAAFVLDGSGLRPGVKQLATFIINTVNKSETIRIITVRWYTPQEVESGALGFSVPSTAFIGALKPWAIRVDWRKIAETPTSGLSESSIGDVRVLIATAFFLIAGLMIVLKFTEKSVNTTLNTIGDLSKKTFPWALAGLAGIALIKFGGRK